MSKARDIADLDFNAPDIDGGNIDGAVIGGTTAAAGSFSGVNVSGGSQLGQDYAYFKSNSTSNASLTLRKDSSGADAIDFLQLRNNGNGLIGKIEGDGDISFGAATFGGKLTVSDGGNATIAAIRFNAGLGISSPSTDQMNFITSDTTRLVLDSNGNVLVAGTSINPVGTNVVGHVIGQDGRVQHSTTGNTVMKTNQTTVGDSIQFRVGGATVGSIGTDTSGNLQTVSATANYRFGDSNTTRWSVDATRMYPMLDNTYDIGLAALRPRNLHLSGTAYANNAFLSSSTDQGFPLTVKNTDTDSSTYIKYQDWAGQYWTSGINYANNDFYFNYQGALKARFLNAGGLDTYGIGEFGIGGNTANNYHVKIRAGTTGLSRVIMSDTTDSGYIDYNHNGDYFSIKTSGAEALNIFTGGDVTATGSLSSSGGAAKVGGTSTVFTSSSFTLTATAQTVVPRSAVMGLPTGVYLMTIFLTAGNWYSSTVTGIVQHHGGTTNSNSSGGPNEIYLTSSGHAQNSGTLYARYQTTLGNNNSHGVQIWASSQTTTPITIKWKRLA